MCRSARYRGVVGWKLPRETRLHPHHRQHAREEGQGLRTRTIGDLPQPRRPGTRHRRPPGTRGQAGRADRRLRQAERPQPWRPALQDHHQARPQPVPARHPQRAPAHRQGQDQNRGEPGRITENTTGDTWPSIRRHLDRLHAGTFTGPASLFRQRTELSKPQRDLLAKLGITAPKQIVELTTPNRPFCPITA
jgi:hypothetical protein